MATGLTLAWRPVGGFTGLIHFGSAFADQRLPELNDGTIVTYPGYGYDGQFYAQLAVNPDPASADIQRSLDLPAYRSRRILLPWIAHIFGLGQPGLILQVFALLNVAAWLAFLTLLYRSLLPADKGIPWAWAVLALNLGVLESVHLALTDLPATLAISAAIVAVRHRRGLLAAGALALAGLTRETSLLALPLLWTLQKADATPLPLRQLGGLCLVAAAPALLWLAYLALVTPAGIGDLAGNFDWPGLALTRHVYDCAGHVAAGDANWRHLFGPLAAVSLAYQSIFVLRLAWRERDPIAWAGAPFALLFWFLGDCVWAGYWAVARACLPLTLAFNLRAARNPRAGWHLVLGNLTLPHGLLRFITGA